MFRLCRHRPLWAEVCFVPSDVWVGIYWTWKRTYYYADSALITAELHLYLCLVPCVPLHVVWGRRAMP